MIGPRDTNVVQIPIDQIQRSAAITRAAETKQ